MSGSLQPLTPAGPPTGRGAARVRNHALVEGNKRLGWLATEVSCFLNGRLVVAADDDKFDLVVDVAAGAVPGVQKIAERLEPWLTPRGGD